MESDRWTNKDKLDQYKGMVRLYDQCKMHNKEATAVLRKVQTTEIQNLTEKSRKYRCEVSETLYGDRQKLVHILSAHPKKQLAFRRMNPQEVEEQLKQSAFHKNKHLDRLRYKKKRQEDVFLKKKLELAELQTVTEGKTERMGQVEELLNQIQHVAVKQAAAQSVRQTYHNMINVLKKDAIRFNEIIEALQTDSFFQCRCIIKATELGQAAAVELASLENKYGALEKEVRDNMKERDKAVRSLKAEIELIRANSLRSSENQQDELHQSGSLRKVLAEYNAEDEADSYLKAELAELEEALMKIRDAALVLTFQDILPRMTRQINQKIWLQKQVDINEEHRTKITKLRNNMDVMLEVVFYHTMTDAACRYKQEKEELLEQIARQKKELKDRHQNFMLTGKRILDIRTALLTLNIMLDNIYPGPEELSIFKIELEGTSKLSDISRVLNQQSLNVVTLLELVSKKVAWLLDLLDKTEDLTAETMYSKPLIQYTATVPVVTEVKEDEYDTMVSAMLDELGEMDDPSILTRKDIKAQSRKIIEQFDNPRALLQGPAQPNFIKHKCF